MAYSPEEIKETFKDIITQISRDGLSLRKVLNQSSMPSSQTFYGWIDNDKSKSKQYGEAIKSNAYKNNIKCKANKKGSRAKSLNDYRVLNAKKSNKKRFPIGSIYLIEIDNSSYVKIGVSQNIPRRFRDLESASPFNLNIIKCRQAPDPYDLEDYLHNLYSEKYVKSEWFKLDEKDIVDCKKIIDLWQGKKLGFQLSEKKQLNLF